jgi:hypothetical protein
MVSHTYRVGPSCAHGRPNDAPHNPLPSSPISSPENSNRHPILLFQISHLQALRLPYPTIPRPTTLRIVNRESAISVASPEVERRAYFDAVFETVHESLRQR